MSPPKKPTETLAKLDEYRRQDKESPSQDGAAVEQEAGTAGAETAKVLEAISSCQASLTSKIKEVKIDISLVRQDLQRLNDRVTEAETRLSTVEDSLPPLQTASDCLQLQVSQMLLKQDDMENRLRRCNIRLIGLPKGAEGSDPSDFLEQLLIKTYGRDAFSPTFVVERAHRKSGRPPPQGTPPRTFITKLLNYRDRDAVLGLSREKGNIPLANARVAIFPDFSAEVQRRRNTFMEAK